MNDYQKSFSVTKSKTGAYTAVTEHIADWWTNDLSGASSEAGDCFNIAFGNTRKTMEIVEVIPNEKVVWKCVAAYIDMAALQNKAEWVDTHIIWTFSSHGDYTTVNFLHAGLHEHLECYAVCESGWDYFLASLQAYIDFEKGTPNLKKTAAVTA